MANRKPSRSSGVQRLDLSHLSSPSDGRHRSDGQTHVGDAPGSGRPPSRRERQAQEETRDAAARRRRLGADEEISP